MEELTSFALEITVTTATNIINQPSQYWAALSKYRNRKHGFKNSIAATKENHEKYSNKTKFQYWKQQNFLLTILHSVQHNS